MACKAKLDVGADSINTFMMTMACHPQWALIQGRLHSDIYFIESWTTIGKPLELSSLLMQNYMIMKEAFKGAAVATLIACYVLNTSKSL